MNIEREFIIENIRLLSAKGYTQRAIASTLHISLGSVNNHIQSLRQQAKHNISKYIEEDLPIEYERTITGLNQILTQAWQSAEQADNMKDRFMNLTLAKECYSIKLELLSNASVVDRAIKFIEKRRQVIADKSMLLANQSQSRHTSTSISTSMSTKRIEEEQDNNNDTSIT